MSQDEDTKDRIAQRSLRKKEVVYKMGFSVGVSVVGTGLVFFGITYVGLFMIGAGLYGIAPKYVKEFFRRSKGDENGGE